MSTAFSAENTFATRSILGVNIARSSYGDVVQRSLKWAGNCESRALFFANVHVVMEAFDRPTFRDSLNRADIVNADGMPLVWALRALGDNEAQRVYGPDLTVAMLAAAEASKVPVGFYGGSPAGLAALIRKVKQKYPAIRIVHIESPPFRILSREEDEEIVGRITRSGVRLLFVGLGCPKQEAWIMDHVGKIPAVMFGVGAAFDFLGGTKLQAPRWMMRAGLEWAFRLACEPRRLAVRYLKQNPRFIVLFIQQLLRSRQANWQSM